MFMKGKNVRIALVNPPFPGERRHPPNVPLGLAYLAAVAEKNGHAVSVVDCLPVNMDYDEMKKQVTAFEPDIIGITSTTTTIQSALQAAHILKESCPNALTIMGGPHVTFMDTDTLNECPDVDVIVRREGEETLLDLARYVTNEKKLDEITGITFRKNEKIVQMPDRPLIQNLDELPFPALHHFPLTKYKIFGKTYLPIITSRGCPFKCSFCVSSRMVGNTLRTRSPKNVVDELEWLKTVHGAEAFVFYDDILTFDKKRIYDICDEIKKRKIGLPWDCTTRVDQVSRELFAKIREANCQEVFFGVESGCQQIINEVHKRTSIDLNEKAIKWAKEANLFVAISLIIGYPGETRETLKQTLDFVRRVKPDDAYLSVAMPFPGTELRTLIEKKGWKMTSDWTRYDTMTPVFENPDLPSEEITNTRRIFYDTFYSPRYVLRQAVKGYLKGNFYSKIMARTALNHFLWRVKARM
jgi:anaerobic magnesium-protoporphyrin IX monomethyl ester cyclase